MLARITLIVTAVILSFGVAWAGDKPPATTYLIMGTPLDWKFGSLAGQYVYTDPQGRAWTVKLRTQGKVEAQPKYLRMTVSRDGLKPVSKSYEVEGYADNGTLAVYNFDPGMPVFVMTDYTMGAHCCTEVNAVLFNGQKLVAVDAGSYDGDGISVRDLNGDGTYEIEGWDSRFFYTFGSYGGSLPARQILKIREKGVEDVTDSPDYQAYMIGQINKWGDECANNPSPGTCAGALGTAAKAGLYQSVAADVDFQKIDNDNRDAEYLNCTKDRCGVEMKFWNYREALEFQLNDWGYNTDSSMNERTRTFFRKLASYDKGFGVPDSKAATACGEDAVKITMDKAGQFARLDGHEYSCRIEKANILDDAAVSLGLCAAEGESYSTLLVTEFKQDKLYMASVFDGAVNPGAEPEVLAACH